MKNIYNILMESYIGKIEDQIQSEEQSPLLNRK